MQIVQENVFKKSCLDGNYLGTRISGRAFQQKEWWTLLQGDVDKAMWLTGKVFIVESIRILNIESAHNVCE